MYRTPMKSLKSEDDPHVVAAGSATITKSSSSSSTNVRRSIGEWESGQPDARSSFTPPKISSPVLPPHSKPAALRRLSTEASGSPPKQSEAFCDRVAEAKACVLKAKLNLSHSRNLKTDIKAAVTQAINRLFQLVKEADADSAKGQAKSKPAQKGGEKKKEACVSPKSPPVHLEEILAKHMKMLKENTEKMGLLRETIDTTILEGRTEEQKMCMGQLLGEVRELRQTTEEMGRKVSSLQETVPSYAEVLARPTTSATPRKLHPKHSIIVSSDDDKDTSDHVLGKVRHALEAKTTGFQVTRVQKVRNQKVVLSCASKDELSRVSERIKANNKNLNVEEAKNKDPLVMIRNLLTLNTDAEIVSSLRSQNKSLLRDLGDEDFRAAVKYRRKARNPHENHVVLQVSPKLWQKLTEAKRVHIDLQYAAVQDQSPLVQCTRCLGYGHGRRLCTESVDLCSYCAGPHLRADCPAHATSETATCRNCRLAKYPEFGHNAFDRECPVRKRWDAIARSSVAYC